MRDLNKLLINTLQHDGLILNYNSMWNTNGAKQGFSHMLEPHLSPHERC